VGDARRLPSRGRPHRFRGRGLHRARALADRGAAPPPLILLTFVGGFFPIVGAFIAGAAATLVALVSGGVTDALLVLAATIAVQQLESHLLQPVVMSRAVKMHPVGVLLAVTTGGVVWGIVGAALAVPLVAVIARSASHLRSGPDKALVSPDPASPPGTDPAQA
jgi:predicted PurR-regulated permease PerM